MGKDVAAHLDQLATSNDNIETFIAKDPWQNPTQPCIEQCKLLHYKMFVGQFLSVSLLSAITAPITTIYASLQMSVPAEHYSELNSLNKSRSGIMSDETA